MLKKKMWARFQRVIELFTQNLSLSSRNMGSGIKPIPDPGSGSRVKKEPDPGSATLVEKNMNMIGDITFLICVLFFL
jgi:hypothetical protein